MNEHASEPQRGLPVPLAAGEAMLWQGSPLAWGVARRVFHIRILAIYFAALEIWHIARLPAGDDRWARAGFSALWMTAMGAAAIVLVIALAWLVSRTTQYTITNRRLVILFGVALPMSVDLPLTLVDRAGLRVYRGGSGDIPLSLAPGQRVSFAVFWPHVRPWRVRRAEPMLRCVPQVEEVGRILAQALSAAVPAQPTSDRAERAAAGPPVTTAQSIAA